MSSLNKKDKNSFWKRLREKIYKISPTYRKVAKIYQDVQIIKKEISINSLNYNNLLEKLFNESKINRDLNIKLGHKIISKGQYDIVLSLANNIVKNEKFLILDIGASDGWFFEILMKNPNMKNSFIIGYEPLKIHINKLNSLKKINKNFDYYSVGIGDQETTLEIKESTDVKGLSSFLDIVPGYNYCEEENINQSIKTSYEVKVITLDSEFRNNNLFKSFNNIILKIDVQGFEMKVLNGAKNLINSGKVVAILIELCTIEKYKGSSIYTEIFDFLHTNNFILFDLLPFFREINPDFYPERSGRMSEFDAIFIKRNFIDKNLG